MAKPILVANWKNHPNSLFEARNLLGKLKRSSFAYKKWAFFIAPPLVYFESVSTRAASFANLASQDIEISHGTETGVVTLDILKSFGTRACIIGHSDCRARGETDELINQKIKIALRAGMMALLCVGEVSRDHDGEHFEFLRTQLQHSLAGLAKKIDVSKLIVTYEPVWAIGKSARDALDPAELPQTIIFIKKVLSDILGRKAAERVPILYGGSVEPDNAKALLRNTGIRGFLVGHASLNARSMKLIAESISK